MTQIERCPTCDSPDPARHPAMQFEGEVEICKDKWHGLGANLAPIQPAVVRGWLTDKEGSTLRRLASGKVVLEIGSFVGKSTMWMAETATRVYALDWHRGDPIVDQVNGGEDTLAEFWNNIKRSGLTNVIPLVGRTEDMDILGEGWADLVFIDGCHLEESVRRDIALALRCVKDGGTIALHDWDREQVRRAWGDLYGGYMNVVDTLAFKFSHHKNKGNKMITKDDLVAEIASLEQQKAAFDAEKFAIDHKISATDGAIKMTKHLLAKIESREATVQAALAHKAKQAETMQSEVEREKQALKH